MNAFPLNASVAKIDGFGQTAHTLLEAKPPCTHPASLALGEELPENAHLRRFHGRPLQLHDLLTS